MSRYGHRYYLITGLNEGEPIRPYAIDTLDEDLDFHLDCGPYDNARYYEPISKERYQEEIKKQRDFERKQFQETMQKIRKENKEKNNER